MQHASFGKSLLLAVLILVARRDPGRASTALIVVFSRIPDVVVTLTTGFIWGGVALLILERPGGGAPAEFLNLAAGTCVTPWLPNALILLVVAVAVIWLPLRSSRLGLFVYAIGSDRDRRLPQRRRTSRARAPRLCASAASFSAVGGIGLTMTTGIGAPLAGVYYTLERSGRDRHRRRQPDRRARRHGRAGDRRLSC